MNSTKDMIENTCHLHQDNLNKLNIGYKYVQKVFTHLCMFVTSISYGWFGTNAMPSVLFLPVMLFR